MHSQKLLFILDDDLLYSELLAKHLSKFNFKVESFNSGQACIDNMYKHPYLVILDFNLGAIGKQKTNGKDIFLTIATSYPKTKIVMISNQKSGKVVLDLIQSGVRDYVEKDSDLFNNLDDIIESYL